MGRCRLPLFLLCLLLLCAVQPGHSLDIFDFFRGSGHGHEEHHGARDSQGTVPPALYLTICRRRRRSRRPVRRLFVRFLRGSLRAKPKGLSVPRGTVPLSARTRPRIHLRVVQGRVQQLGRKTGPINHLVCLLFFFFGAAYFSSRLVISESKWPWRRPRIVATRAE